MTHGGRLDSFTVEKPETLSDEALVDLVRGGAQSPSGRAAMSVLIERYQEKIYLWCYRRLRNRDLALDAAQDVLISIVKSLEGYRGDAPFSAWAFIITRNRCFRTGKRAAKDGYEEIPLELLADEGPQPDEWTAQVRGYEETFKLVSEELDPLEQRAVWLRCFEELPVDEITRELKLEARSGARGLLQNARRKLRAAMERRGRSTPGGRT